jgi:hypothetical protein
LNQSALLKQLEGNATIYHPSAEIQLAAKRNQAMEGVSCLIGHRKNMVSWSDDLPMIVDHHVSVVAEEPDAWDHGDLLESDHAAMPAPRNKL